MASNGPLDPTVQRIIEEEKFRASIAGSLTPLKRSWLNENTKWILATIAIPLTTYIFGQYQQGVANVEATSREKIATADRDLERILGDARNNVTAMTALLPALSDSNPDRTSLALIVLKQLEKAQHSQDTTLTELVTAVQSRIDQLSNSSDQAQREKGARQQEVLSQATGASPTKAADTQGATSLAPLDIQNVAETKPRIVYIQIYEDAQNESATAVQKLLRAAGVGAPGIEKIAIKSGSRIGKRPPRIFFFNDADLGGAKWLQQHIASAGLGNWTIKRSYIAGVPAGQIELWWPHEIDSGS